MREGRFVGEFRRAAALRPPGERREPPFPRAEEVGLAGLAARGDEMERVDGVRDRLPVR